ncbi:secondary metabolism regulator laeA [Colletotrichum spaethianum]|uniref:Secondary metabolism regulator laeA n=1 Tax=Colletotrichum spaethianum TaxID=700344 RepID=A0AA37NU47_9PEZI|nr:secondary metabolism regulator laeA [Colletotrichum spaethianum]GKT41647.1 secondary metabolism regulator laeA [Colletotrichum spaethianum]
MSGSHINTPIVQQPAAAIEAVDDPSDDSEFDPEELDANSISSYSLNSSLYAHENSNGCSFHRYRHGRYPMPNDQTEQNREDMKHAMLVDLTVSLSLSNEVADPFPGASVVGTDLSPMQPNAVPPNLRFYIDDAEDDDWLLGDGYGFVYLRSVAPVLRRLDRVLDRTYE